MGTLTAKPRNIAAKTQPARLQPAKAPEAPSSVNSGDVEGALTAIAGFEVESQEAETA